MSPYLLSLPALRHKHNKQANAEKAPEQTPVEQKYEVTTTKSTRAQFVLLELKTYPSQRVTDYLLVMATVAAFYAAVTAWLSLKGQSNHKLSGVMELHKLAGMRQYSASILPDRLPNSIIEEPEAFEGIFRDGSPKGYILVDIETGQFYSNSTLPEPTWRVQLTFVNDKYDKSIAMGNELEKPPVLTHLTLRRYYNQPQVEIGPGAFKYEMVSYPPNFLQMNLQKLIKIKQKMEDKMKEQDLNSK